MADETENTTPDPEKTEAADTEEKTEETIEEQVAELKEEAAQAVREAANAIERFFDVTLGTGALVAEKLDANLRRIWDDTPGVVAELEERGRPIRQQLSDALKGKLPTTADAFKAGGATEPEDEIEALENRVKELEQQVGEPAAEKTDVDKSPYSMLELDETAPKPRKSKKAEAAPEERPEEPAAAEEPSPE